MAGGIPSSALLLDRLSERIGNPLEWSDASKCLLVALATLPFSVAYFVLGIYLPQRPEIAPYLDLKFLRTITYWVAGGNIVWWSFVALLALWLRRRQSRTQWLVYATTQVYILSGYFFAYAFGHLTNLIGIIIIGVTLVGFVLFDMKPVLVGIATGSLFFFGSVLPIHWGWIPYAPALAGPPFEPSGVPPGWWLALMTGIGIAITALVYVLSAYIVIRWRDREEKLQEAHILLQAQQDQLVRAESLAVVGSLVTGAAHELRNPLGSSGALLQSLRDEIANSDASGAQKTGALGTIEMALAGQRRAAAIVERLYSLTDSLAHVDARRPVEAILEALRTRYPSVTFDVGAGLPGPGAETAPLPVNERALTTILSNLIENALAAGGKGPVRLSVGLTGAGAAVPSPPRPPSPNRLGEGGAEPAEPAEAGERDSLLFTISDTGRGIAKDQQAEIFQPFFTGEKTGAGHGVGLGLYVVYELVTRMGGTVELESEVGRGTRARVRVPVGAGP